MADSIYEYYSTDVGHFSDTWGTTEVLNTPCILGQTFKVGTVGKNEIHTIKEIKFYLEKVGAPAGNLYVEIRTVDTSSPVKPYQVVASGTIAMADIGAAGWYSCTNLTGNTTLQATTAYAISISHLASTTGATYIKWYGTDAAGGYAQGWAWISSDNTATWTAVPDAAGDCADFAFQMFGGVFNGTMCSYQDVVDKVGSGANTDAIAVGAVGNYVRNAESILNGRTKKNWTDIYTTLNADVKYLFNEIVSNMAAIKVINFDTTNYNSRLEAGQMIEQLRWGSEKLINELKNESVKNFIENA